MTASNASIHSIVLLVSFLSVTLLLAGGANAQCTALTDDVCQPETTNPQDYSINQIPYYWAVVGVIPTNPDDKDIYLYPSCGSGSLLASSTGTNGTDFIVGDFNHNAIGAYYPQVTYGGDVPYEVYWNNGGAVLPIGSWTTDWLGGTGAGCNMIHVYDVLLEAGAEYRFIFDPDILLVANVALFRNPSAGTYWAGRAESEFEMSSPQTTSDYTAPATDWYGLVLFVPWNTTTTGNYSIKVEKLSDCIEMDHAICDSRKLYTFSDGPANNFHFLQEQPFWTAFAVIPDTLDHMNLYLIDACDANGSQLGSSYNAGVGQTELVVGDFGSATLPADRYPYLQGGEIDLDFTVQWDGGADLFFPPKNEIGTMSGTTGECNGVQIWDLFLEAGHEYEFFFYKWGQKDPHLALFENLSTGEYWGGRVNAEFELATSGTHNYTAPQSDYYGLVVFADNRKEHTSGYEIQVQKLNDCMPLTSMVCAYTSRWPNDFSFAQSANYWSVVGVLPAEGDVKRIALRTQCDGKGTLLAESPAFGGASFIVSDFNHSATGTYFAHVTQGDQWETFSIQSDNDAEQFPYDTTVEGVYDHTSGCGAIKIWDVYLEAGKTYQIGFTRSGLADMRLSLFRNPGNGDYFADRLSAEWELGESETGIFITPTTDWYGLVVFANKLFEKGWYSIRISPTSPGTGVDPEPIVPDRFALYQNAPNPFNPSTIIRYDVPSSGGHVSLIVYDVNGRLVRSLKNEVEAPGEKSVTWDARDNNGMQVSSGVYFYRLVTLGYTDTRKMVVTK